MIIPLAARTFTSWRRQPTSDLSYLAHYLGSLEHNDLQSCRPHLDAHLEDEPFMTGKSWLSAMFNEYIPGLEELTFENVTQECLDSLHDGIKAINSARVLHNDPFPKNMMVFSEDPARAMWLDFDRAETYSLDRDLTRDELENLEIEDLGIDQFAEAAVSSMYETAICSY